MFTAHLVGAKLKTARVEDLGPPERFVNNTVYRYRMVNGQKVLIGTMEAFPEGWDNVQKKPTVTGRRYEEDENMKKYNWGTLWPQVQELLAAGKLAKEIAAELEIDFNVLRSKIYREEHVAKKKQTPDPEPEKVGRQDPVQEIEEPAKAIIPKTESINPKDEAAFNTAFDEIQKKQEGFTPEDELPINYVINEQYIMQHHDVAEEIAALLDRKRADYGIDNIKKFGSLGCLIRTSDKVERLINLRNKKAANFETLEDTWRDIAGYAILALIELRGGR